jgi:hypothetical protein
MAASFDGDMTCNKNAINRDIEPGKNQVKGQQAI